MNRIFQQRTWWVLLAAAVLAVVMVTLRTRLIEPDEMGILCSGLDAPAWPCRLRGWLIQGFANHWYGPISMVAAVLAWLAASAYLATLAMIVGMIGVVLYDFDWSALALLLSAVWWAQHLARAQR